MNMGKELSEMTLEELWELFPIFLIEPDEKWVGYYDEIASFLQKALNDLIEHNRWKQCVFVDYKR